MLFGEEKRYTNMKNYLESKGKWCVTLLFERVGYEKCSAFISENVQFGILSGNGQDTILKPPLKLLNGPDCVSLASVVDKLIPQGSSVRIHSEGQFLRIDKSEKCGLIEYKVGLEWIDKFLDEFKEYPEVSVTRGFGDESNAASVSGLDHSKDTSDLHILTDDEFNEECLKLST